MNHLQKVIFYLYCALFILVPLVLWPYTSEVFEFNKMVVTYIFTVLITATWLIRSVKEERFILRRTILDIPLLIFLASQTISTILSIDPTNSFFGYYSRFNGGLLSSICYSLLYWAFVSNLNSKHALYTTYALLFSAVFVAIYGVLEHFGIDKNIWVQDVQSRVFSTLGQPNWLAAYLVALLPIVFTKKFSRLGYLMSTLFFVTLLFTKSRSGLIAFGVSSLIYWLITFIKNRKNFLKPFLIHNSLFLIFAIIIGTQFTPSISTFMKNPSSALQLPGPAPLAPETGGTESGEIRKIVWKGAIDIWRHYPVFGTGLETFAFTYYQFRPIEHNLVSEWDFIYNKAHNEYLNLAANSGSVGLISYLLLTGAISYQIIKMKKYEYFAGIVGLFITNFFGFSVVTTQLQLFLYPAIALILNDKD